MRSVGPELGPAALPGPRLDSWKEIAAYLRRDLRTVQRWERDLGLPVQRLPGGPRAGVFAMRPDLDEWLATRQGETDSPAAAGTRARGAGHFWSVRTWAIAGVCGAAAVAVLAYVAAALWPTATISADQVQFKPFAAAFPVQVCPEWSPDGGKIAFIGKASGAPRLYVQGAAGANPVEITGPGVSLTGGADAVFCRPPIWSPDSEGLYFLAECGGRQGVWRISAGGGQPVPVQEGAWAATLSPDGSTLAFLRDGKVTLLTATPPQGPAQPYEPAPFDFDNYVGVPQLRYSPDGASIFVSVSSGKETLTQVLPWPAGPPRSVIAGLRRSLGADWAPDSKRLLVADGPLDLLSPWNGVRQRIATQPYPMSHASVSPDGTRVAFQSGLSHADVIAMPLEGGEPEVLLGSTRSELHPAVSATGDQMVYITDKRRAWEIWIKDLVHGQDRPLVGTQDLKVSGETANLLFLPILSPDSRRLAFGAATDAGAALFTMVIDGGSPVVAGNGDPVPGLMPTWSPDGEWIAYVNTTPELAKVAVAGRGEAVPLARTCRAFSPPEWSPGGEWIAAYDEKCGAMLVSPDGARRRALPQMQSFAWSRDGRTLYGVRMKSGELIAYDVGRGTDRVLRKVGDLLPYTQWRPGWRGSLARDGKRIVYSVLRAREEIWTMEGFRIGEPWYASLVRLVSWKRS